MVSRMALLMLWMQAAGVMFILEQPASSLMCLHPRMLQVKAACGAAWRHTHTWLGMFGAKTQKPTRLWSSSPAVHLLHKKLDTKRSWDSSKVAIKELDGSISGGPELKATQAYPVGYGQAVSQAFLAHRKGAAAAQDDDNDSDSDTVADPDDAWDDAELRAVCEFAGVPHNRLMV